MSNKHTITLSIRVARPALNKMGMSKVGTTVLQVNRNRKVCHYQFIAGYAHLFPLLRKTIEHGHKNFTWLLSCGIIGLFASTILFPIPGIIKKRNKEFQNADEILSFDITQKQLDALEEFATKPKVYTISGLGDGRVVAGNCTRWVHDALNAMGLGDCVKLPNPRWLPVSPKDMADGIAKKHDGRPSLEGKKIRVVDFGTLFFVRLISGTQEVVKEFMKNTDQALSNKK